MATILAIIKLIFGWLNAWSERDLVKKEEKKQILKEAKDAITRKDTRASIDLFDRLRRL